MPVVGFNFNKINVEKADVSTSQKINISNNVSITNIEERDVNVGSDKRGSLKVNFEFKSKYDPEVGGITLNGTTIYISDKSKEILEGWIKDKKIPKEVMTEILNAVLSKCNIQALIMSQYVSLPPPIPLPKVNTSKEE